jgi:hypothetical protein
MKYPSVYYDNFNNDNNYINWLKDDSSVGSNQIGQRLQTMISAIGCSKADYYSQLSSSEIIIKGSVGESYTIDRVTCE